MKNKKVEKGDILLIKGVLSDELQLLGSHYFIALDTAEGRIKKKFYNLKGIMICSVQSDEHEFRLKNYQGTVMVKNNNINVLKHDSYVNAQKVYYFNKDLLEFQLVDRISEEYADTFIEYIDSIEQLELNLQNLRKRKKKTRR
ncbi:MAG: hypothetical protein R3Y13_02155 [bacterium]